VGGLLGGMSKMAERIYQESWSVQGIETLYVDILMYGMMMVFAILASLLLHQAPSIANGLVPGGGATGFSGIRALTQSSGSRIGSSVASGAMGSAGGKVAAGGSFMRGVIHGNRANAEKDMAYRSPQGAANYGRGYRAGQKLFANRPAQPSPPPASP
jgi:hypothetical protein